MGDNNKVYVKLPVKSDAIRGVYEICEKKPEEAAYWLSDEECPKCGTVGDFEGKVQGFVCPKCGLFWDSEKKEPSGTDKFYIGKSGPEDLYTETAVVETAQRFEVDEEVWYKGKKWIIADRNGKQYALWEKPGGKEVDGWIDEQYLAKATMEIAQKFKIGDELKSQEFPELTARVLDIKGGNYKISQSDGSVISQPIGYVEAEYEKAVKETSGFKIGDKVKHKSYDTTGTIDGIAGVKYIIKWDAEHTKMMGKTTHEEPADLEKAVKEIAQKFKVGDNVKVRGSPDFKGVICVVTKVMGVAPWDNKMQYLIRYPSPGQHDQSIDVSEDLLEKAVNETSMTVKRQWDMMTPNMRRNIVSDIGLSGIMDNPFDKLSPDDKKVVKEKLRGDEDSVKADGEELTPKDFITYQNKVGTPIAPDEGEKQRTNLGLRGEPDSMEAFKETFKASEVVDEKTGVGLDIADTIEFKDEMEKQKKEHPWMTDEQLSRVAHDHIKSGIKETADYKTSKIIVIHGQENIEKLKDRKDILDNPKIIDSSISNTNTFIKLDGSIARSVVKDLVGIGIPQQDIQLVS